MYPDIINQVNFWALDDVTVRGRDMWKERGRQKRKKKRQGAQTRMVKDGNSREVVLACYTPPV